MSDQGFSLLSEGCNVWPCQGEKLEVREGHAGGWFWTCPKCGGSYGAAPKPKTLNKTNCSEKP